MGSFLISVVHRNDPVALSHVTELFREYHAWLGDVVCATRLTAEIDDLPGPYDEPSGRLLLARDEAGRPAGCVGVRPHDETTCEIKRLFVREEYRGAGLGRSLARYALDASRELGYREVRLTTLPDAMQTALRMYRRLGFEQTAPFEDHSHVGEGVEILFMSRRIQGD
jgi:carbonic anhydrase